MLSSLKPEVQNWFVFCCLQSYTPFSFTSYAPSVSPDRFSLLADMSNNYHMWQSHVEIEGYSVAYFERIAVLEAPYL